MRTRARRWVVPLLVALSATMPVQDAGGTTPAVPPGSCAQFGLTAVSDPVLQRSSTMPMFADGGSRYLGYSSSHPTVDAPQNQLNGFRLDLDTGSRIQTSVHPSGGPLPHGAFGGALSADGNRALFYGNAEYADIAQLFVRDIPSGRTLLVSTNMEGGPASRGVDHRADISPDGRFVAFTSPSFDLVPDDYDRPFGPQEVFLRDVDAGTTERITGPNDVAPYGTTSQVHAVSAGGRFVTFSSEDPVTTADTYRFHDTYVWDRTSRTFDLVTVDQSGRDIGGRAYGVSDDANTILFFTPDPSGSGMNIYVRDRTAATTRLLFSYPDAGLEFPATLSGDGRWAAVGTKEPISANDVDGQTDVLLIDTRTGSRYPVEAADALCSPTARLRLWALSYDGSRLAAATAWVDPPGEPSEHYEIFSFDVANRSWEQLTPARLGPFGGLAVTGAQPAPSIPPAGNQGEDSQEVGYWMLTKAGGVHPFGAAGEYGPGGAEATDLEPTPAGDGYWILQRNGTVTGHGRAVPLGSGVLSAGEQATSLSATPTGRGYWTFTNRGRVLPFGDAAHLGDMSATKLNGPVLGSVATLTGRGYYMVAADGGIFAFGDAAFAGSMGGKKLNAPVQSLVPDADGKGYWLVAADGGIFAFDAPFRGSMGETKLNKPVVGMVRYGDGYLMVGADGGIFNFSTSPFAGSLGDKPPASPVVAVAALPMA